MNSDRILVRPTDPTRASFYRRNPHSGSRSLAEAHAIATAAAPPSAFTDPARPAGPTDEELANALYATSWGSQDVNGHTYDLSPNGLSYQVGTDRASVATLETHLIRGDTVELTTEHRVDGETETHTATGKFTTTTSSYLGTETYTTLGFVAAGTAAIRQVNIGSVTAVKALSPPRASLRRLLHR